MHRYFLVYFQLIEIYYFYLSNAFVKCNFYVCFSSIYATVFTIFTFNMLFSWFVCFFHFIYGTYPVRFIGLLCFGYTIPCYVIKINFKITFETYGMYTTSTLFLFLNIFGKKWVVFLMLQSLLLFSIKIEIIFSSKPLKHSKKRFHIHKCYLFLFVNIFFIHWNVCESERRILFQAAIWQRWLRVQFVTYIYI